MIQLTQERVAGSKILALGVLLAALVTACLLLVAAAPTHAAMTFTVDRIDDPDPTTANACSDAEANDCSLRGAIFAANASAGADAITVPAGDYTVTRDGFPGDEEQYDSTGDLDIKSELTITGAGASATSVVGGPEPFKDRIFDNRSGATTTITNLTITGGKTGYEGGGVRNEGGLTLDGVAVEDNTADTGGGVDSRGGDLTLDGVTVKGNTSDFAGGIYSEKGALNFTDSTVSGNVAAGSVGGISSYEGTLNLTDSTVSGNSATNNLGGLGQAGGTANITNTTISGNKAANFVGGFAAESDAVVNIRNSTIASNESDRLGGGISTTTRATVLVKNTIVAGNTEDNCETVQFGGDISSQGNNISSDNSCNFSQPTDKRNTNPRLGPLQDNGGPTDTHALLKRSPAIDAGGKPFSPTDQRGVKRPQGKRSDIGAYEKKARRR